LVMNICVEILTGHELQWIFSEETPNVLIVVSGAIVRCL